MKDTWSKDFIEHLRTVHFAMVTLCITLVVITTSATPFDYSKIRDQLSTLQKIKNTDLQTIWDDKHPASVPENIVESDRLNCESLIGRTIKYIDKSAGNDAEREEERKEREHDCKAYYLRALVVKIDDQEFGVDIDPAKAMDIADFVDRRQKADLAKLNNFEPFWKYLNEAGFREQTFGELASLNLTIDDATDTKNQNKRKVSIKVDSKKSASSITRISLNKMVPPLEYMVAGHEVRLEGSGKFGNYTVSLSFQSWPVFTRLFPSDLKVINPGSSTGIEFDSVFRELMRFVKFHALENAQLEEIRDQLSRAQGTNSNPTIIAGISVPSNVITPWGVLLLAGIQLYFWIHVYELANRIQPDSPGWDVAWVGVYNHDLARNIFVLSACVLPAMTTLILGFMEFDRYFGLINDSEATLLMTAMPAGVLLAWLTYTQIERLRRNRASLQDTLSTGKAAGAS